MLQTSCPQHPPALYAIQKFVKFMIAFGLMFMDGITVV